MPPAGSERGPSDGPVRQEGAGLLPGIQGYEQAVEIGRGGFAVVFRAWQPAFKRHVAIKLISVLQDRTSIERFERECLAVGALSGHPNIVTVHEMGQTADGRPFIVMEYLSGGSLADRLEPGERMPWQRVVATGVKLAGALEAAHRAAVLHRDVKPANVLISRFDEPKLADFGIARIQGRTDTRSGAITASFAHAAPEVISGQRPVVPSDVYSLGSTLFELLAGRSPFFAADDESLLPMLARIVSGPTPDLRVEGVPPDVCDVIESALAKDPLSRPTTAAEFGRRLRAVQARHGATVTPLPLEGEDGSDLPSPPPPVTERPDPTEADTVRVPSATPNLPPANPAERPTAVHRLPDPKPDESAGGRKKAARGGKLAILVAFLIAVASASVAFLAWPSTRKGSGIGHCPSAAGPVRTTTRNASNSSPGRLLFADDFSDPSSGWTEIETAGESQCYANGAWEVTAKKRDTAVYSDTTGRGFASDLSQLADVAVEVVATKTSGNDGFFGVTCRNHPEQGAYYFAVLNGAGRFLLGKKGPSPQPVVIADRTIDIGIKRSPRIRLECSGGGQGTPVTLRMFVDGSQVATGQDPTPLSAGAAGLYVVSQQSGGVDLQHSGRSFTAITVRFDDFSIRALP